MNYIKQLSAFFEKATSDLRLNPSHVSLYMALFQFWNMNRFENPISINRGQVMKLSKIGSSHTYLKCLNELHSFGYINYLPSHNPLKGSLVYLCIFDTSTEQVLHNNLCNSGTSTEQALHPSINSINIINKEYEENTLSKNSDKENMGTTKNNKSTRNKNQKVEENKIVFEESQFENFDARNQDITHSKKNIMVRPSLSEVIGFFKSEDFQEIEARKFFNHFESNGWKVGGKTPMKNWNAAARNWMINSQRFITPQNFPKPQQKPRPKPEPNNKNYSEPL